MAVTRTSGRRRCASSSSSTRSTCARGRGEESVERVEYTRRTIEAIVPAWLDKPVSAITDADMFAFRSGRASGGAKPSTINRDLRTLRAALKKARPEYRFPGGAFFREDEASQSRLHPDAALRKKRRQGPAL
jgi:hypothetical protein